jgi:hypothetical protein
MRSITTSTILQAIVATSAAMMLVSSPVQAQTTRDMGKDSSMGTTSSEKPTAGSMSSGSMGSNNSMSSGSMSSGGKSSGTSSGTRAGDNSGSAKGDSGAGQVSRGEAGSGRTTDSKSK